MRTKRSSPPVAGRYDKLVTIRATTLTPDGGGGYTEAVSEVENVWASVDPLEGREQIAAMQTGMQRPYRITMRYRDDVTGVTLILYDARTFDVKSVVDPEEKHRELVILAEQVTA